jgi:small subunit ribosomal protein S6
MKFFESVMILKPNDKITETLLEIQKNIIRITNDIDIKAEIVGSRKLAYKIKDYEEGYYVEFYFKNDSKNIEELEEYLKDNEEILKHIVIRIEEE